MQPFVSSCWRKLTSSLDPPGSLINVIVRDGIVELWGTILDERKRQALLVVA